MSFMKKPQKRFVILTVLLFHLVTPCQLVTPFPVFGCMCIKLASTTNTIKCRLGA
jgi:hypothetical protein